MTVAPLSDAWRLRVFVYPASAATLEAVEPASGASAAEAELRLRGTARRLPGFDTLVQRPEYGSVGDIVWARMLASPCRVTSAADANLFLVPHPYRHGDPAQWWPDVKSERRAPLCQRLSGSLARWRAQLTDAGSSSYMSRRGGRDHLLVAPFLLWANAGACEVGMGERSPLGAATRVGVDGGPGVHYHDHVDALHREHGGGWLYARRGHYLTAPPVAPAAFARSAAALASEHGRAYLAAYVGGSRGEAHPQNRTGWVHELRDALLSACGAHAHDPGGRCGLICIAPVSQEQLQRADLPPRLKRLGFRALDGTREDACRTSALSVVRHQVRACTLHQHAIR